MQIAIKIIKTVDGKIAFDKIDIICIKNDLQAYVYACKRSGLINPKIETLSFLIFFISCIKRLLFLFHITWLMWWTLDDESKCTFFILQDVPTSSFTMGILCFDPSWPLAVFAHSKNQIICLLPVCLLHWPLMFVILTMTMMMAAMMIVMMRPSNVKSDTCGILRLGLASLCHVLPLVALDVDA